MSFYSSTVMNDTPVAYYRLNETGGTTAQDASGNNNAGTYSGTGVTYRVSSALSNDPDTAVTFDGTAGLMTLAAGVNPAVYQALTIEFWLKLSTLSQASAPTIIANDNTASTHNGLKISINAAGTAIIYTLGNGSTFTTSTLNYTFATNTWYHLVFVWSTNGIFIYVNGVLKEGDNSFQGPFSTGAHNLTLAHGPSGTDFFQGSIDELAIYNTGLAPARIIAHYQAASIVLSAGVTGGAAPSGSLIDLHTQKIQVVQVFDAFGNFVGVWPDAPRLTGLTDTINSAQSQVKMVLPRNIDNFMGIGGVPGTDTIALGNQVQIWLYGPGLPMTGMLKFNGFIDIIEPSVTEEQQQGVTVTLTPYSAVFGDHGYGNNLQFTNIDPVKLFQYWFTTIDPITNVPYTSPMVWAAGNPTISGTGNTLSYLVQNQDLKSIADTVLQMLGFGWFWRPNPDNTVTLGQFSATPQHLFQLGQHMASMSYSLDQSQRKNVVYFVGSTPSIKAVAKGPSALPPAQGGIGERILFVQDSRITDSASAAIVANALLTIYDITMIRAKCRLVDYRGDSSGLGYDIENLKVGDTVTVLDTRSHNLPSTWGSLVWGQGAYAQAGGQQLFNTVVPIVGLTYGWSYVDVELGVLAPRQDRQIFQIRRRLQDFTVGH